MAAARSPSLLFQLPRFVVSSRLGALHRRPSPFTGLQRMLAVATSHKEVAAHGEGDAIVAASRLAREPDVAAELLAGKRRAPYPQPSRPDKPKENPGKDKHNDVPDEKAKKGKQGTRNNYAAAS